MNQEHRCISLGDGLCVEVSPQHGFGEDALLLASFAGVRPQDSVCDLGTGCGILPLLWCRTPPFPTIHGVEIQYDAALMAQRSVERCGLGDHIVIHHADLRLWKEFLPPNAQDVVTMNPPYFAPGSGGVSLSPQAQLARHEGCGCSLSDIAKAACGLLRNGGRFCLCHRPERLCDLLATLRGCGLEPKRIQLVQSRPDTPAWLVLCEARKGGKPGLTMQPTLIQNKGDFPSRPSTLSSTAWDTVDNTQGDEHHG